MNASDREPAAVIVYESMFGATRRIAEALEAGLREVSPVALVSIADIGSLLHQPRVVIVGAPTHGHGLSRPESRVEAARWALHDRKHLTLEPGIDDGVREWLQTRPSWISHHAAFDTRADMPRIFSGSAAAAIDRRLTKLGSDAIDEPHSFLVDRTSRLLDGEEDRAREWGRELGRRIQSLE